MMLALFTFLCGYFFYDWKVGYPKKQEVYNAAVVEYTKFITKAERLGRLGDEAGVADAKKDWIELSDTKDWEIDRVDLSPADKVTSDDIQEQFNFGVGAGVLAAGVLIWTLINLGKTLSVDGSRVTLPNGKSVSFSDIFKVDTRRWGNKGLATIHYKDASGGAHSAKIDGLKFGGFSKPAPFPADQILDQIVQGFDGDLVELEPEGESAPK